MTSKEFTKVLNKLDISYKMIDGKIIVNDNGNAYLPDEESLPPNIEFRNKGDIYLYRLASISPGVIFNNSGGVHLKRIMGGWWINWEGNIDGMSSKRLLNMMIKQGVFER
jgi:hypothetical protein